MDRKRVIGEVAARHGVRLEKDDPAFILVTIAELTLKDAQQEFLAASSLQIQAFEKALDRTQRLIGTSRGNDSQASDADRHSPSASPDGPWFRNVSMSVLWFACGFSCAWLTPTVCRLISRLSGS
jgi:hypothetical protein